MHSLYNTVHHDHSGSVFSLVSIVARKSKVAHTTFTECSQGMARVVTGIGKLGLSGISGAAFELGAALSGKQCWIYNHVLCGPTSPRCFMLWLLVGDRIFCGDGEPSGEAASCIARYSRDVAAVTWIHQSARVPVASGARSV